GIVHLDEGFYEALSKAAGGGAMAQIDLSQPLPALKPEKEDKPAPEATPRSLETGFRELVCTYSVGRRLHQTVIDDEKTLAGLHKSLVVLTVGQVAQNNAESRNLTVITRDGAHFYFHIQGREAMFDFRVGHFTLKPGFVEA